MSLYLDASALVKRYVREEGTDVLVRAMSGVREWSMCRIGFVETTRAVARGGRRSDLVEVERDWIHIRSHASSVVAFPRWRPGRKSRISSVTGRR